ncbi:MAG: SMC-Scp complex subunit ScpB [Myxococcales bacterium]|nr:SMC-Scp complex subunit ScpB [Myxococcales bacterium]
MSAADPLPRLLGALLLATERPLTAEAVADLINQAADEEEWPTRAKPTDVEAAFRALTKTWDGRDGVVLARVGGGWRLRTAPDLSVMVRRLWPDRATRLSKAALEALAVVAYRQPCTRLDVEDVRGVDCGGVLRSLLDRKLLRIVGRKDEPGRPLLYGTTPEFLETFSLPDLRALPTLRDLESMRAEDAARAQGGPPDVEPAPALPDPEDLEAVATDEAVDDADAPPPPEGDEPDPT